MKTPLIITILLSLMSFTACTPYMAATSDGPVAEDYGQRTLGTVIEDNAIESKAIININLADPRIEQSANVQVKSFNRVLLITGQIPDKTLKKLISDTAEKIRHVRRVHNELEISKPITLLARSRDSFLKTKIKSRLIGTQGIDSGRIEVIVENEKAYLMGLVTQHEADRVVDSVKKVSGLKKIVRAFEYISTEVNNNQG